MRKLAAALVALPMALGAGAALAADLPTAKAPPAPVYAAPVFTWTGFYVGAQGGWSGGGDDKVGLITNTVMGSFRNVGDLAGDGGFIGLRAGYDYQMPGSPFVVGVLGDINYNWIKGSIAGTTGTGVIYGGTSRIDWEGSLRLKAGYAIDRLLIYATGGVAFANQKYALATFAPLVGGLQGNGTHVGWTVGAGLQYAVTNNLIAGLEYRYSRFEAKRHVGAVLPAGAISTVATPNFHRVAATLDWKF